MRCCIATSAATQNFRAVEEADEFLSLFPHRYDFIYADVPEPGAKPNWKTESRYPLPDRTLQQGGQLFGVRFGKSTHYCLLDIDITSAYHPQRDPFAIAAIVSALEPLGLVGYLACTSSHSGGLHLYFPVQPVLSWQLAAAVSTLLTNAGFKLLPGQLEVFPNPRPYSPGSTPSLFHAHRLPLQIGSYLLNADFQPIWSDRSTFLDHWRCAQQRNQLDRAVLKHLLKATHKPYSISGKAEKFLDDLNTEIAAGWTGTGQTNRLLGRIALRAYVFHHLLTGEEPLTGQALANEITATARSLPGYQEWCQHQTDIEQRSAEWGRCVEASRYFPYGSRQQPKVAAVSVKSVEPTSTWNQQQMDSVRSRIGQAIAYLLETNALPAGITDRFRALVSFGISGSSLYRHRDLWHPTYLATRIEDIEPMPVEGFSVETVEIPPHPPTDSMQAAVCAEGAPAAQSFTSLFAAIGCNARPDQSSGALSACEFQLGDAVGCNQSDQGAAWVHPTLVRSRPTQLPTQLHQTRTQWMQQLLESGDPILVAEARSYFAQKTASQNGTRSSLQVQGTSTTPLAASELCFAAVSPLAASQAAGGVGPPVPCQKASPLSPTDVSDLLATIGLRIRRNNWTRSQVQQYLKQRFGKPYQALLNEDELLEWSNWLRNVDAIP
jgi:hypothetical protein